MSQAQGLTPRQRLAKRSFDLCLSAFGLLLVGWLIVAAWIVAAIDTRGNGFFTQVRVGRNGRPFRVIKIKTMDSGRGSTVTVSGDPRITRTGVWLRRLKLDELPHLINVLIGDMSFVGPRPDVPGYADCLEGDDRIILRLRPGITGPATLKYRDEESLLASRDDPEAYNRDVIWPDKVRLNRAYLENWSLRRDWLYIWQTLRG